VGSIGNFWNFNYSRYHFEVGRAVKLDIDVEKIRKIVNEKKLEIKQILHSESKILEKNIPGVYLVECLSCGIQFEVKQYNWRQVSKLCSECKISGGNCVICGRKIAFGMLYCKDCIVEARKTELWNHKQQGEKIKGDRNPSKRPEVRVKLSEGALRSYSNDPNLRLKRIIPPSRILFEGAYYRSKFEVELVSYLLDNNIDFEYEKRVEVDGRVLYPDFVIQDDIAIEVAGWILNGCGTDEERCLKRYEKNVSSLLKVFKRVILVTYEKFAGYFVDCFEGRNVTVITDPRESLSITTIFKEDICNVDYSHFLFFHDKACKRLHGHTSWKVGLVVRGYPDSVGMVIDYGDIKKIVTEVIKDELDHKLIVSSRHIKEKVGCIYVIEYITDVYHRFELPESEVFIIDDEPTCENITSYFVKKVLDKMPSNVTEVGLLMREGNDNGCLDFVERKLCKFLELKKIIDYYKIIGDNIIR